MTCYVAGIACCDFMTANKLTLEYAPRLPDAIICLVCKGNFALFFAKEIFS